MAMVMMIRMDTGHADHTVMTVFGAALSVIDEHNSLLLYSPRQRHGGSTVCGCGRDSRRGARCGADGGGHGRCTDS
eukprot:3715-Eustigmatos_ZCMA.PRE.1